MFIFTDGNWCVTYLLSSQENLIFVYTYIAYIMSTYYKQYSITCVYVTF